MDHYLLTYNKSWIPSVIPVEQILYQSVYHAAYLYRITKSMKQ